MEKEEFRRRCTAGEREKARLFEELFVQEKPLIDGWLHAKYFKALRSLRLDASDVTQQAFLNFWRNHQAYLTDGSSSAQTQTYLCAIGRNFILDKLKAARIDPIGEKLGSSMDDLLAEGHELSAHTPDRSMLDCSEKVLRAYAREDPDMAKVIALRAEGKTDQEIAEETSWSLDRIRKRVHEARKRLSALRHKLCGADD